MQVVAKFAFAALAAALVLPASAAEYGRAGGTVGAERIQQIAQRTQRASHSTQVTFQQGPGRAGGAAVYAILNTTPASKVAGNNVQVAQWYGRAGGPLPFGG
jgi:hypothetical protein